MSYAFHLDDDTAGEPYYLQRFKAVNDARVLRRNYKEMASQTDGARLWQHGCLEVTPRLHHVGIVDKTRRTCRHHGRQRDALRRIATFRHATLRVATHRYATFEPLGKPGGSRAFNADAPLNRLWLRDACRRLKPRRS